MTVQCQICRMQRVYTHSNEHFEVFTTVLAPHGEWNHIISYQWEQSRCSRSDVYNVNYWFLSLRFHILWTVHLLQDLFMCPWVKEFFCMSAWVTKKKSKFLCWFISPLPPSFQGGVDTEQRLQRQVPLHLHLLLSTCNSLQVLNSLPY